VAAWWLPAGDAGGRIWIGGGSGSVAFWSPPPTSQEVAAGAGDARRRAGIDFWSIARLPNDNSARANTAKRSARGRVLPADPITYMTRMIYKYMVIHNTNTLQIPTDTYRYMHNT
jgi:hypothetical protein